MLLLANGNRSGIQAIKKHRHPPTWAPWLARGEPTAVWRVGGSLRLVSWPPAPTPRSLDSRRARTVRVGSKEPDSPAEFRVPVIVPRRIKHPRPRLIFFWAPPRGEISHPVLVPFGSGIYPHREKSPSLPRHCIKKETLY